MTTSTSKPNQRQIRPAHESGPLATMRREFEDLMDRFWNRDPGDSAWLAISPRVDLAETEHAIEVSTDLPGVKPEEVQVELRDNCLVISAEHEERSEEEKDKKFHRVERRHGSYSRSVWLPASVDESKVEATLRDGVLKVTLPKTETAETRRIQVNG